MEFFRGLLAILAVAAALALPTACGPQPERPNVVVLLMDTLRADRLGCYGYARATSPAVDSLAAAGVVFTRCYAPSDYTQASTASLFTGKYPLAHGYVNSNYVLEDSNLTIAEIFRDAGYTTAGFIANGLAGRKYRMDQGFEMYFEKNRASAPELSAAATAFIGTQSAAGGPPFFMYLHFLDVHDPHRIPPTHFGRFADPAAFAFDMQDTLLLETFAMRAWWSVVQKWRPGKEGEIATYFDDYSDLYDASIAYWDDSVAAIRESLAANGFDRNTIIVVTSDHGEQLLEHGFFGHANSGYEVGLHVPLILFDPYADGGNRGRRLSHLVGLVDVLPTLLNRVGIEVPAQVQGRSRWPYDPAPEGTPEEDAATVYTEGTFFKNRPVGTLIQSYRQGDWKLLLDRLRDSKELYDLRRDPGETRNLFDARPEIASRLFDGLRQQYNGNLEIFDARSRSPMEQVEEKLEELQSLGYVTAVDPPRGAPAQYFPIAAADLTRFGPFGDEEDLHLFNNVDFSRRGRIALGQIVRGCSEDPSRADTSGVWFDRRSTFLLRNDGRMWRIFFEILIDPHAPLHPTRIQVEFNDAPGESFRISGPGHHRLESALPASLCAPGYFHAGLLADRRFVLRAGTSPRSDRYASIKIRRVGLGQ